MEDQNNDLLKEIKEVWGDVEEVIDDYFIPIKPEMNEKDIDPSLKRLKKRIGIQNRAAEKLLAKKGKLMRKLNNYRDKVNELQEKMINLDKSHKHLNKHQALTNEAIDKALQLKSAMVNQIEEIED